MAVTTASHCYSKAPVLTIDKRKLLLVFNSLPCQFQGLYCQPTLLHEFAVVGQGTDHQDQLLHLLLVLAVHSVCSSSNSVSVVVFIKCTFDSDKRRS
jgi:hypothetical protein